MSIAIKKNTCIGCKKCVDVCPGSLIKMEEKKAFIKYPQDCWGCSSCIKECPVQAISLYLGADIGGVGSKLTVVTEGAIVHWNIEKSNGVTEVIDVNRKDSNQY